MHYELLFALPDRSEMYGVWCNCQRGEGWEDIMRQNAPVAWIQRKRNGHYVIYPQRGASEPQLEKAMGWVDKWHREEEQP